MKWLWGLLEDNHPWLGFEGGCIISWLQCPYCQKWWGIEKEEAEDFVFCTWCGKQVTVTQKKGI